jgi:hypothetical protein
MPLEYRLHFFPPAVAKKGYASTSLYVLPHGLLALHLIFIRN